MRSIFGIPIPFVLAVVGSAMSKLIFVPFNDPRIVYDSHWTLQPSSRGSNTQGTNGTPTISPGSTSRDVCSQLVTGHGDAGATVSSFAGASFTFEFTGVTASILTTSGSGAASYSVTRDINVTTSLLAPGVLESSDCRVTYETARLPQNGTSHTLTVSVDPAVVTGTQMRVLGIVYDDGDADKPTAKSGDKPAGLFIGIAVASGLILLLILLCTLYWCRRQTRSPLFVEQEDGSAARRVLATRKAFGILSSTPTFLQHDDTKKYRAHVRLMSDELTMSEAGISQSKSSSGFSGYTLLRPPVPPKMPRPVLDLSNNRLEVPSNHCRTHSRTQSTTAGTVVTSFSV